VSKIRIQKVLAEAGVASRRAVEEMILEGRVEVNGQIVNRLPCFVDPDADRIRVDGQTVARPSARKTYILLNKPKGIVCAARDTRGRPRVYDLVPPLEGQTYCLGGLDVDSTGLVLLTNDGAMADRLSHPRYGVPRTYLVEVDGHIEGKTADRLTSGIFVDGRRSAAKRVRVLRRGDRRTLLEITLVESAGREVRPLLMRLGHKSRRLKRTAIGPVTDRGIKIGKFRLLNRSEIKALMTSGRGEKHDERM
jgi:23S rRNA pseudouridine2605 synthase